MLYIAIAWTLIIAAAMFTTWDQGSLTRLFVLYLLGLAALKLLQAIISPEEGTSE